MRFCSDASSGDAVGSTRNASLLPPSALRPAACASSALAEVLPAAAAAVVLDLAGARVVVQRQDRGLIERRRVAPWLSGCSGLPSILVGRPSHAVASTAVATPPCEERGRVVQRAARDHVGRLDVVGKDPLRRVLAAGDRADAGERERAADELHELAARRAVELAGAVGELARDLGSSGLGGVVLLDAAPSSAAIGGVGLRLLIGGTSCRRCGYGHHSSFADSEPCSSPTRCSCLRCAGQPCFSRPSSVPSSR